jgi:hypothetical protein
MYLFIHLPDWACGYFSPSLILNKEKKLSPPFSLPLPPPRKKK